MPCTNSTALGDSELGWEDFSFLDERERQEFFDYAEAGMIEEASEVVDRVYARMFPLKG